MERNPIVDALYLACVVVTAFMALELVSSEEEWVCICGNKDCRGSGVPVVTMDGKAIPTDAGAGRG